MESEPLELAEQDSYADYGNYAHYANYAHQPAEDQDYVNTVNPRIVNHSQEIRGGSPGNQNEENTRLFRSIVKQYGPKEQKEHKHSIEQRQQKFSFQPEISEMPREIYGDVAEKLEITKEEQWERILKPKNETIQERERQKYEKEAKDIQENCTFQPNISSTYELSASKYNVTNTLPTTDRLYKEGIEKLKTKEIERRRTDGLDECTFQPDVAKSTQVLKGEKLTEKPLYTRLGDIMKQKQEFLQKIRIEAEQSNKDLAFKPKLNEHSNILADAKQQIRDVTDRLMKDAADKIYKKMKQAEEYEEKLTSVCTFKPNVNPISRSNDEILARNDFYAIQKDTVTRQYLMADKQRENLQKKAKEIMEKEGCTFAPQINKISQFLIEADPQRANENLDEKVERLSKLDAQKKEIIQEQMKKAHYEKFTFKPEINKISKDIGKKATLEELAYNLEAKEHLQILREKSIDNMLTECSFKPTINRKKKYENVEPYFKEEGQIMDNVSLLSKKKEIKYDQQRKIEEYDEMKECTFKPRIKGDIDEESLRPKLNQKVAGIDKFMQVRDKHKRQKEEQRKREEEVFDIAKKYSMEKHEGFTVQQPFKLSKGSKDSIRNARAAQELREKFEKEHPFKPMTNEGKNREIINKAIANGERFEYSY